METITIILFDKYDEVIVRQKMEIKDSYKETRKLINDNILYLVNYYGEDSDISKIEIFRE